MHPKETGNFCVTPSIYNNGTLFWNKQTGKSLYVGFFTKGD